MRDFRGFLYNAFRPQWGLLKAVSDVTQYLLTLPLSDFTFSRGGSSKIIPDHRGVLITVPDGVPAFEGARLTGGVNYATDDLGNALLLAADYPLPRENSEVVEGDKRYVLGQMLGVDVVVNGGFADNTAWGSPTDWTLNGTATITDSTEALLQGDVLSADPTGYWYASINILQNSNGVRVRIGGTWQSIKYGTGKTTWGGLSGGGTSIEIQALGTGVTEIDDAEYRLSYQRPIALEVITGGTTAATPPELGPDDIGIEYTDGTAVIKPVGYSTLEGYSNDGQVTNLITYSEEIDNAAWSKSKLQDFGSGSVVNAIASPCGTITAELIVENTDTNFHKVTQSKTVSSGVVHTWTMFAKAKERTYFGLETIEGATTNRTTFNLTTGTVGTIGADHTASIEPFCNGWYRCSISWMSISTSVITIGAIYNSDDSSYYAGDGASGLYIWGGMLNVGPLSSYIPTTTTSTTRAADEGVKYLSAGKLKANNIIIDIRCNLRSISDSWL